MSSQTIPTSVGQIRVANISGSDRFTITPTLINSYSALTVPAYWRAINIIAACLASFPRAVRPPKGATADATPHPLAFVLGRKPNGYQNAFTFWSTFFFHASHMGNGYARIGRAGATSSLHNLDPVDIIPFRYQREGESEPTQYYMHRPTKTVLLGRDVIHLRTLSYDGMTGADPIELHESTMQRAATIDRYQTKFLQQGTVIRGAIEIPTTATPDQVEQLKGILREYFYGPEAEEDLLVLSGGATLKNTTLSPHDSQLVQQSQATTKSIAQMTGVPPDLLFELSEGKYNGSVEQAGQNLVRYTLRPWIEQTEDELTSKLLSESEQRAGFSVRLNPDALLRGDTQQQVTAILATTNGGLRTKNEGRELLDLPRMSDHDADKLVTLGSTGGASAT